MKSTELTAAKAREMVKKAHFNYTPENDDHYGLIKQKIKDAIGEGLDSVVIPNDRGFTGLLEQRLLDEGFSISYANEENEIEIAWKPE